MGAGYVEAVEYNTIELGHAVLKSDEGEASDGVAFEGIEAGGNNNMMVSSVIFMEERNRA